MNRFERSGGAVAHMVDKQLLSFPPRRDTNNLQRSDKSSDVSGFDGEKFMNRIAFAFSALLGLSTPVETMMTTKKEAELMRPLRDQISHRYAVRHFAVGRRLENT